MSTPNVSGTVTFEYGSDGDDMTRVGIAEAALADWRTFVGDPAAELPWNTSITVEFPDEYGKRPAATVTIRWERTA